MMYLLRETNWDLYTLYDPIIIYPIQTPTKRSESMPQSLSGVGWGVCVCVWGGWYDKTFDRRDTQVGREALLRVFLGELFDIETRVDVQFNKYQANTDKAYIWKQCHLGKRNVFLIFYYYKQHILWSTKENDNALSSWNTETESPEILDKFLKPY